MRDIRCIGTLHGVVTDDSQGEYEVKCKRKVCGVRPGIVVFHIFDLARGTYHTQRFADPIERKGNGIRR
jgi:hypothetical protein